MQLVINISKTIKRLADEDDIKSLNHIIWLGLMIEAIREGTPLPKGHGRLIDADEINLKDISPVNGFSVYGATAEDIDLTPTVLEAESEKT